MLQDWCGKGGYISGAAAIDPTCVKDKRQAAAVLPKFYMWYIGGRAGSGKSKGRKVMSSSLLCCTLPLLSIN